MLQIVTLAQADRCFLTARFSTARIAGYQQALVFNDLTHMDPRMRANDDLDFFIDIRFWDRF